MQVNVVFKNQQRSPYIENMLRQELQKVPVPGRLAHIRAEISRTKLGENVIAIGADESRGINARVSVTHRSMVRGVKAAVRKFRTELHQLIDRHRAKFNRRMHRRKDNGFNYPSDFFEQEPIDAADIIKLRDAGFSDHHGDSIVLREITSQYIVEMMRETALRLSCLNMAKGRVQHYEEVARTFERLPVSVDELKQDPSRLLKMPKMDRGMARRVGEIINTGRLSLLEVLRRKTPKDVNSLLTIRGIGPKRLQSLHQELGIDSMVDLKQAAKAGLLRNVKGVSARMERRICNHFALSPEVLAHKAAVAVGQ